jgi:hypothetical protein
MALSQLAAVTEGQARRGLLDAVSPRLGELKAQFELAARQLQALREELLQATAPVSAS